MSPRRCAPTTACACCCATSSASPRARHCKASTGVCWARELRRRLRNLLRLRQQVGARDLADKVRMVLPNVLLRVLPELILVLARDDPATDARDLLHALIVCGKDLNTKQLQLQRCEQQGSVAWSAVTDGAAQAAPPAAGPRCPPRRARRS